MQTRVYCVTTQCSSETKRGFGGTNGFYLQNHRLSQARNEQEQAASLLFDPENRKDVFLRNVGQSPNHAVDIAVKASNPEDWNALLLQLCCK
jgi:hypothetical protein